MALATTCLRFCGAWPGWQGQMNESVKFTSVQDWMAERGEGFIKQKAAECVKNLQRFRGNKNAITI